MVFVFYDLETTGRSTKCDQFMQFAAFKTKDELNASESFLLLVEAVLPSDSGGDLKRVHPAGAPKPAGGLCNGAKDVEVEGTGGIEVDFLDRVIASYDFGNLLEWHHTGGRR